MGGIGEVLATINLLLKAFMEFKDWIKVEKNKKALEEALMAWKSLRDAQTHEERQNAAKDIASIISR